MTWPDTFTFPNIKQKFGPLPEPCKTKEEFDDFVASLFDGVKKHKEQVEREIGCEIKIVLVE